METFLTFIAGVVVGAGALFGVYAYLQRNNVLIPTPEQAEIIVKEVIWAIRSAQEIYGNGAVRATEAETLAKRVLTGDKIVLPDALLRVIIRVVYHVIKKELPPVDTAGDSIG
jgi:hypothetical protein